MMVKQCRRALIVTADPASGDGTLTLQLDQQTYAALSTLAATRELAPEAIVTRWVQERLAREALRPLRRERLQRRRSRQFEP